MYAVDWINHVHPPCEIEDYGEYLDDVEWGDLKEVTFCADTINNPNFPENCDSCCFTVVYYDDVVGRYPDPSDYLLFIAGIFYEGTCCELYDKDSIADYAFWKIIQARNTAGFRDSVRRGQANYHMFMSGHCYEADTVQLCNPAQQCCRRELEIYLELKPGESEELLFEYNIKFPPDSPFRWEVCSPPCVAICGDFKFEPIPLCDMPCNKTPWIVDSLLNISVPGCAGCEINIVYKYRETQDPECDPPFNDYEITSVNMSDSNCTGCLMLSEQEIFQFALGYLLKSGPLEPPMDGQCQTSWRTVNATCWKLFPDGTYEKCPETEGCCWSQYEICNIGGVLTYTKINGSSVNDTCWKVLTHICGFVCDLLPENIYQDPMTVDYGNENMHGKYSYAVPNPSSESTEILLDYNQVGKVEVSIFDKLGRNIKNLIFDKDSRILKMPIKNDFPTGVYSYKIKLNNKIIDSGSFVVIK